MIIYSITYFINSIGFFTNKRDSHIIKVLVVLLLAFMTGTRYYMGGSDVYVYEGMYKAVPAPWIIFKAIFTGAKHGINSNYELGFQFMCSIIKTLGFSYFGFILLWSILFYSLLLKGLEEFVPSWAVFFAVFMYKLFFYNTFISIRQGMTLAIFCIMLKYIRDRKWFKYYVLCVLALLVHNGAILLFPLYFITYIPISKKFIHFYALAMAPTWFLSSYVDLSSYILKVAELLNSSKGQHWAFSTERISVIHTLECYVVVILVLLFYDKIIHSENEKEAKLSLQLFLVTLPMFTLFRDWIILTREKDYFVLMYGILFGYILDKGTTSTDAEQEAIIQSSNNYDVGERNARLISLGIIAVCFLGMMRFVFVFDGGVLKHFTSFITEGVSIFR